LASIKKIVLSGFFWSLSNQLSVTFIGLGISGVLTRLISPAEFGIVGMVTLSIGFLNVIKDFGFGAALIQKKTVSDEEYSTVFWINIIVGSILTLVVFSLSPFVGEFFKESRVATVSQVLSFTFIINSIGIVWNNRLIKDVAFKQIFYRSLVSTVASGGIAILFASLGYGVWALVIQTYSTLIFNTYLNYVHVRWLPSLVIKKEYISSLFKFGLPLLADQSINYWVRNLDSLLVGRTLGKETLAYYNKGYSLMLLPVRQLSSTLTKVLFPSFSLIQDDKAQVANIYLKISRVIAFVAFPLMLCLSALAEPLILIVYGDNWRPVIPIFQVLSILGMFQALGSLSGNIYLAFGRTKLMFQIGLVSKGLMILGIILGLHLGGLMGMVYGYSICSGIAFMPELFFIGKLLGISLKDILLNFLPYLLLATVSLLLTYVLVNSVHINSFVDFILKGAFFATTYLILNLIVKPKAFLDMFMLFKNLSKSSN
jgi:O-antigen/teichoic acid export membrane protein